MNRGSWFSIYGNCSDIAGGDSSITSGTGRASIIVIKAESEAAALLRHECRGARGLWSEEQCSGPRCGQGGWGNGHQSGHQCARDAWPGQWQGCHCHCHWDQRVCVWVWVHHQRRTGKTYCCCAAAGQTYSKITSSSLQGSPCAAGTPGVQATLRVLAVWLQKKAWWWVQWRRSHPKGRN